MNCEEIGPLLNGSLDRPGTPEARQVTEHLAGCESCKDGMRAVAWLRVERDLPIPGPRPGAFRRAMRAALQGHGGRRRRGKEFWRGLLVGAAAAAAVAVVSTTLFLSGRVTGSAAPPAVALALHEPGDISIAIDAPVRLRGAEIHVSLRGAVDLRGFEGQRDVHWKADLEQGINRLTLPVLPTGEQGGQVQVVVTHGNRQKTFLVDVATRT